ncbi:unnamed protein product [Blepharisma stoltei]|uniref:VWFA domain-containing protein n=1 Tax=Blepharisma stoltei TaxID=1481888 RepID=A0AAU9IWL0_9CILI|nr:unnamed protein product [Blepharisma stoltei]
MSYNSSNSLKKTYQPTQPTQPTPPTWPTQPTPPNWPTHPTQPTQNLFQNQDSDRMILDDTNSPSIPISQSSNNYSQSFNPVVSNQGQVQTPQFQQNHIQNYQPQNAPIQMQYFQQAQPHQMHQIQQIQQMKAQQVQFQTPGQPQNSKLSPISQVQQPQLQSFPIPNYQSQYQMSPGQPQYSSYPISNAQPRPVPYQQPQPQYQMPPVQPQYSSLPISNSQLRPVPYQQPQPQYQIPPGQPQYGIFPQQGPVPYQQPQYSSIPISNVQPTMEYKPQQYSHNPISNSQTMPMLYQQPQPPMQYQPQSLMPLSQSVQIPSYPMNSVFSSSRYIPEDLPLILDDDDIQIKPITEETKTSEGSVTASMNFLFNYLELKDTEQEIPCTLSLTGSNMEMTELQRNRAGLDLICVVDVSGSMGGDKLDLVKKTLEFMLTLLNGNDRVSIVIFSDSSSKIIKLTAINETGKIEVEKAIRSMQVIGGTNIVSGLQKGFDVAINRRIVNQVTSVLLLTDGCDNDYNAVVEKEILYNENNAVVEREILYNENNAVVEREILYNENNTVEERAILCSNQSTASIKGAFTVHTFGYGRDHNARAMQEIAKANNGNFYYVENPKDIAEAFANCLGELVSLVADKVEVALSTQECNIPFHLHKVYSENGDTHFTMPQVFAGNKKDSVFLLKFPPTTDRVPENEIIKPVKARISYVSKSGENKIIEAELSILVVNEGRDDIEVNEDVMVNFYRCKGAEILKEVASLAEARKFNEAKVAALNGANELKNCIVNEHTIVKALIHDLEDAANRASSNASWEQGGRAQVSSLQANHFCQKASNNSLAYQNVCQTAYSSLATNYFNTPKTH